MAYNSATDVVRGADLFLYVGTSGTGSTTPIAFATSVDLQISADSIDTTNKMSGKWKTSISGQLSYTVNTDFLYTQVSGDTGFDYLFNVLLTGGTIDAIIGVTSDSTNFSLTTGKYWGKVSVGSLSLKADKDGLAQCSATLNSAGALVKM